MVGMAGRPRAAGVLFRVSGGTLVGVIVREMVEQDLDALFDIQDDAVAQRMAAFTSPDDNTRDGYLARGRKNIAKDEIMKKVIEVDGEIVGSVASFVVEGDTEVTYWIRRDRWGRGIATAALAELLREVTTRALFARVAADNAGSARVLRRNGFTQGRTGDVVRRGARHRDRRAHLSTRLTGRRGRVMARRTGPTRARTW
jgi:ribosomal-protein-alanine N-acetyltransferase